MGKPHLTLFLCAFLLSISSVAFTAEDSEEQGRHDEEDPEDETADFAWFSLAPEIGYLHFFRSKIGSGVETEPRHGLVVKGHVDLGGDGIAVELAPVYSRQYTDGFPGDFHAVGGEITLVFRFSIGNVYPSLGIGFHGTYLFGNDYFSSGTELYGRVPVGFTWYFVKYLGLVVDVGFLFGGTGINIKKPGTNYTGTKTEELARLAGDIEFAKGFGLDLLIGLRFP